MLVGYRVFRVVVQCTYILWDNDSATNTNYEEMRTHSKHVFILRTLATWNYKTEEGARKREVCRISKRWSWRTGAQLFGAETKLQISKHGIGLRIWSTTVRG